jgi:hypothetical protein
MEIDNTLYYLFSTIAQVLAATAAISIIIIQDQISKTHSKIIGMAKNILRRSEHKDGNGNRVKNGYQNIKDSDFEGLQGGIESNNYNQILSKFKIFAEQELRDLETTDEKSILEKRPSGFTAKKNELGALIDKHSSLKSKTLIIVKWSFSTIIISLALISIVELISSKICVSMFTILVGVLLTIISLFKTYEGIKTLNDA